MKPTCRGIELDKKETSRLFSLLETATTVTNRKSKTSEVLGNQMAKISRGISYVGMGTSDSPHVTDEWRKERLDEGLKELQESGVEVMADPNSIVIPWEFSAQVGRACLLALEHPENALTWIDHSCGGFTLPDVQRTAYELAGQVMGIIAAQEGFQSYHYETAYYDKPSELRKDAQ